MLNESDLAELDKPNPYKVRVEYIASQRDPFSVLPRVLLFSDYNNIPFDVIVEDLPKIGISFSDTVDITDSFFRTKGGKLPKADNFTDPQARLLFTMICENVFWERVSLIDEKAQTDLRTSSELGVKSAPRTTEEQNNNCLDETARNVLWNEEVKPEVRSWLKLLKENNVPIIKHTLRISGLDKSESISIERIIIGNVEPFIKTRRWLLDEDAISVLAFAKNVLGADIPKQVTVFNIVVLEETYTPQLFPAETMTNPMISKIAKALNCRGLAVYQDDRAFVLAIDRGTEVKSNTGETVHIIDTEDSSQTIRHELTHLIDPAINIASTAQAEGLATSIGEFGLSFDKAYDSLRRSIGYNLPVSQIQIEELLTDNEPEGKSLVDLCVVSATFFCYIFEKFGPKKFWKFYKFLTGVQPKIGRAHV